MTQPNELQRRLEMITRQDLSPLARIAHVLLLLLSLGMSVLLLSLLATETALPLRTQVSFAALLAIGTSWSGYAIWVLRHRRILLANQRVVAAWMAIVFSGMFTAGAGWLGYFGGQPALRLAAGLGFAMLSLAVALLWRAQRHRRQLLERRRVLEMQIAQRHG